MAFPPHIDLAIKMLPHLIATAKAGKVTNYDEIAATLGMQTRLFSKPLAFIRDDICIRHNLPPLTVIVENKGPDKPINSFAPNALLTLSKEEYEELKAKSIAQVYAYEKWDRALDGLLNLYCVT